ncbi:MAG: AAA family ATPase [Myxococcota bacterium]
MTVAALQPADALPVLRAGAIEAQLPGDHWLIRPLWGKAAVGIIGGAPKCCKSWLGLDMAVSVASGTPCLDRFAVDAPGPSLVFLAEDALPTVRSRIDAICQHRHLDIATLDLHVITASVLRLDLQRDQQRLAATVARIRPRLLLLDPLVRLHRLDENSASEISGLLGFLRELQRQSDVAVVLVHHASKKQRAQPGQALRGSSDLHAFGDSNAYLAQRNDHLLMTIEHRAAKAPDPLPLSLVSRSDGTGTHLALREGAALPPVDGPAALADAVRQVLRRATAPMTRNELRTELRVNNARLGEVLDDLERRKLALRTPHGWVQVAPAAGDPQQPLPLR